MMSTAPTWADTTIDCEEFLQFSRAAGSCGCLDPWSFEPDATVEVALMASSEDNGPVAAGDPVIELVRRSKSSEAHVLVLSPEDARALGSLLLASCELLGDPSREAPAT